MGVRIVTVTDNDGFEHGSAILCTVTGSFVRPLSGHPQSVFDAKLTGAIFWYLTNKYGSGRVEHKMSHEELQHLQEDLAP
ncbi:hypothetical protein LCGC14_2726010 [marine sediment metagenome]|uniref:Uncharacterized protein n=1 Tax=marine sediment metagenome TaxID=412755 RepID=A0A0F9C0E3_9ZZZZ